MSHKNITLSIDEEVLRKFDQWRAGKPRGEAVAVLLQLAPPTITAALSLATGSGGRWDTDEQMLSERPLRDESEHAMLCRNPDLERRLRLAREAQEKALAGENAGAFDVAPEPTPQILKKKDPLDQSPDPYDGWDEYGQPPPQDDVDQRAKKRGK